MTSKRPGITLRGTQTPARGLIAALLALGLLTSACGGAAAPAASTGAAPTAIQAASAPGQAATAVPGAAGGKTNSKLDCQALANAAFDFNSSVPFMMTMANSGAAVNRVDSPWYIDTAKLRADLAVLAALPDPTTALEIGMMGKPSEAIPQWRQVLDLIDAGAKAGPTPASAPAGTPGMSDSQLLGFTAKFVKMSTALSMSLDAACPGVSANVAQAQPPGAPATPLPASYGIGQTAPVGDLRVTLDRVATGGKGMPTAGNRVVLAYFTVENKGQAPFAVNTLASTHWEDATGKQYFTDPFISGLDPNTPGFDSEIAPGSKQSGAIGYQLPRDAGDLVWVFADFRPNRAVFAVKAGDVATVGTPVTERTADAQRAGAAATQTAFVGMALSAVATQEAAGTGTPAPPEPTETAAPPAPTDPPAPVEDTPTANP